MENIVKRKMVSNELIDEFESKLGYRREICEVMAMRGIDTYEKAEAFLHPFINNLTPYENYSGMVEARDRIRDAINYNEKILIYGDYDCDGVCATAILYLMLKAANADVEFHIPVRKREGYGINREALEEIAETVMPDLIITVDCGIGSAEDIAYAIDELGIDFIVTDHHEPPSVIPECIVVDPKVERREDCFNELCGAGVALRLVEALGGVNAMMYYVDIAALATIADIVPLVSDNRIIVNYGIDIINSRARQSMKLLLDLSYPNEPNKIVNSTDIAYRIVPKINAVGRLADSKKSVELLVDDDYFYAKKLVQTAIETNAERQRLTEEVYRECLIKLESYDLTRQAIVIAGTHWEAGVLGIVSARISEEFRRPSVILTEVDGVLKGSCRSIDGVNLYQCLQYSSMYLTSYGGHAMACGVTLLKDNLDDFKETFCGIVGTQPIELFMPKDIYDLELKADELDLKLTDDMSVLEPFGEGNPPVLYMVEGGDVARVGRTNHSKVVLNQEAELMSFNDFNRLKVYNGLGKKQYITTATSTVYQNRKYVSGIVSKSVFDTTNADINDKYISIRHAYQLLFSKESLFDVAEIDDDEIDKFLTNSIYGSCFLCYNIDTYRSFIVKYGKYFLRKDLSVLSEINPYNRVVLDMNKEENICFYDRVIFLDKPMRAGLTDELKLKRDCNVYEHIDSMRGLSANLAILKDNFPTIARMREIFASVASAIKSKEYYSFSELYPCLKGIGIIEFYLAMYVFYELKILVLSGGRLGINSGIKTSLDKSKIYRRLSKLLNIDISE